MTELVCVDGTVITLTADATWAWGISAPPPPPTNLGNSKDVTINVVGTRNLTVDGKGVILESDITTAMAAVASAYHASAFGLFISGTDGAVALVSITSGLTPSTILRHGTDGVILETLSGNFTIAVGTAASAPNPAPPPPYIYDLILTKSGTWSIKSNGGNTKLKSN